MSIGGFRISVYGEYIRECSPFAFGSFDLAIASLSLHWTDDMQPYILHNRDWQRKPCPLQQMSAITQFRKGDSRGNALPVISASALVEA